MCCPQEQNLSQMVRDFIESESPTIFRSSSESLQVHHESASLSLQEILENVTDAEIEVLGKVLLYLDDTEPMDQKPENLRKWVGLNLKIDSYEASLCKTSWVTTFGRRAGLSLSISLYL
ncbi:unnamed protein product [Ilex paraguariensis]|uniref:Uncharacterized protein n=1 Tax=Ilex paraguariensis TaxID=185542 RepID=A0ABC8QPW5_9AQUA